MSGYPSITVTIAQWGKVDYTARCVESLLRCSYPAGLEILVYDNDSPGGPGPVADMDEVRLIRGESNIGFGPAHNRLAALGEGELLLILNNDTVLTPSALTRMAEALADTDVGAVSPRYLGFDGATLEMGGYVGEGGWGFQLFRDMEPPPSLTRMTYPADYGSAACLLTRRELFLEMGGFDDVFAPAYYEDTDFCFRLWDRGLRVVVEPRAVVYHFEGATAGKETSSGMKSLQLTHREVFATRWSDQIAGRPEVSLQSALSRALGLGDRAVLWISPEIPRPDHEAGHARMAAMLRALRSQGWVVGLWVELAAGWEHYGRLLEAEGIPWFAYRSSGRLGGENPSAFSTLQELLTLPGWSLAAISFPEMAERFVPEIRRLAPGLPIVVDAVDLHFLRMARDPESDPAEVEEWKARELAVYRSVDGVITAGDHELEVLLDLIPQVPVRSFHSVATLEVAPQPLSSASGDVVFLGNANHSPNIAAVDYWADEIYPRLPPEVRTPLHLYGFGMERVADRWPPQRVKVEGWAPNLTEIFAKTRVFVAPLTYGAGTKGKILEASAAGVPVVTTPVGAEGYEGYLTEALVVEETAAGFAASLTELVVDDDAWKCKRVDILNAAREWEREAEVARSEWALWMQRRRRISPSGRS